MERQPHKKATQDEIADTNHEGHLLVLSIEPVRYAVSRARFGRPIHFLFRSGLIPYVEIRVRVRSFTSRFQRQRSSGVERSDGIEPHGAQCRDATGGDGDGGEHCSDAAENG